MADASTTAVVRDAYVRMAQSCERIAAQIEGAEMAMSTLALIARERRGPPARASAWRGYRARSRDRARSH